MQTTITQVTPVEYELEITATPDELAPELEKAVRSQRKGLSLKGFRPGRVPLPYVKKLYGPALALQIAERSVQETYEREVVDAGEHEVLGRPKLTKLDYEMDGDLSAVIRFGVRPAIELRDLSEEELTKVTHTVTDDEVDREIEKLRSNDKYVEVVPTDEPAGETDYVEFDLQELDPATQTPIIGKRDENQSLVMDDPAIEDNALLQALRQALLGAKAGDARRVEFEHDAAHGEHAEGHVHKHVFKATVNEVKHRELPELDEEFIQTLTNERFSTEEELRTYLRESITEAWDRQAREYLEAQAVERMIELHEDVPVPESVVDVYLDSYEEDLKQQSEGQLPEGFDAERFREANRDSAERQARWMLLREKLIAEEDLTVADEDLDAFFEEQSSEELSVDLLKQYYTAMGMLDSVRQRLLDRKVFDVLLDRFNVVEKDSEALEAEEAAKEEA